MFTFPTNINSADKSRGRVDTPAPDVMEVASGPLPSPDRSVRDQQSHQGVTSLPLTQIHPAHAPSIPGCPICMSPARCQPRRPLDFAHSLPASPLAWLQLSPTQKTPGQCPSTPSYSTREGLAHCPPESSPDCARLKLATLPVWPWLASTLKTPSPHPGSPSTRTQLSHAHSTSRQPKPPGTHCLTKRPSYTKPIIEDWER